MKKLASFLFVCCVLHGIGKAQIYMADSCRVGFFSAATIEDIAATNTIAKPLMSTATGEIDIKINNQFFKFKKELMEEHFNEEYMETSKYQYTTFSGKVNEKVDYTKDGTTNVTVTGTMDMHGVKNNITIPGSITVQGNIIFLKANFNVKLSDYKVKVPSVLGNNIAEQVAVSLTATLKPYGKK